MEKILYVVSCCCCCSFSTVDAFLPFAGCSFSTFLPLIRFSRYIFILPLSNHVRNMPKTCAVVGCRTGHKRKKGEPENVNTGPVFDFPEEEKDPELRSLWVKFVNRVDWAPTAYVGICSKHFHSNDIKQGEQRITQYAKIVRFQSLTTQMTIFLNRFYQRRSFCGNHQQTGTQFQIKNLLLLRATKYHRTRS